MKTYRACFNPNRGAANFKGIEWGRESGGGKANHPVSTRSVRLNLKALPMRSKVGYRAVAIGLWGKRCSWFVFCPIDYSPVQRAAWCVVVNCVVDHDYRSTGLTGTCNTFTLARVLDSIKSAFACCAAFFPMLMLSHRIALEGNLQAVPRRHRKPSTTTISLRWRSAHSRWNLFYFFANVRIQFRLCATSIRALARVGVIRQRQDLAGGQPTVAVFYTDPGPED